MALAYWCILVAALLPYVWSYLAKRTGERLDNHDPRGWQRRQHDPRAARADAAQQNAFEALPAFVAAVLMAQLAGVEPQRIGGLAAAFIAFRLLHGLFYVADKPPLRSASWALGFACVAALMVMAALKMA